MCACEQVCVFLCTSLSLRVCVRSPNDNVSQHLYLDPAGDIVDNWYKITSLSDDIRYNQHVHSSLSSASFLLPLPLQDLSLSVEAFIFSAQCSVARGFK